MSNRGGHYLKENIAAFDASFFSISAADAISMDPMQRILLEVVYEAMENAGIPVSKFSGSQTSCFVGCMTSDYDQLSKSDAELLPKYNFLGTSPAILSNRVSFCFDLQGPSVTLDTACSSSLVAIHLACQSIRTGESNIAIVGATNALLSPDTQIAMTNLHLLSPDSICYTFDERANGYARGEGIAALILKPLGDALRDGDTIRAVIRGTAINSDGRTPGISLPSKDAQISLIRSAYDRAGCDPASTGYFEAHGTGTQAGDLTEASAIGATFGQFRPDGEEGKLYVGSIKTNVGHLEGTSGLAGLIKAVHSVERGIIPPNIWFQRGNPAIKFDAWRIRVPIKPTPWPVSGLRRASVNSFGIGGTNAHVIIDDAYHYMQLRGLTGNHQTHLQATEIGQSITHSRRSPSPTPDNVEPVPCNNFPRHINKLNLGDDSVTPVQRSRAWLFYIAAHEEVVVGKISKAYAEYLRTRPEEDEDKFLDDLAFTLCERRSLLPWGTSIVATTKSELLQKLEAGPPTRKRSTRMPRLGFVFSGQGAQWWAMGRELLACPVFAHSLVACGIALKELGSTWSLLGMYLIFL